MKALERAKKQLEAKLKELCADERKDDGLTFEELGVDYLMVDAAIACSFGGVLRDWVY